MAGGVHPAESWHEVLAGHHLEEIVTTALGEALSEPGRRPLLLDGLPRELQQQLCAMTRPLDQIRHDVFALARMKFLVRKRSPPLAIWLWNAAQLSTAGDAKRIFLSLWAAVMAPCLDALPVYDVNPRSVQRRLAVGDRLDARFDLVELLSDGAWSRVWRACDLRLGRDVALKVLHPEYAANQEQRLRFLRGARHMAALDHPHIARVLELVDAGSASGRCYYWMEYLTGGSLEEALTTRELEPGEGLRAVLEAAEGVAVAHASGLLHRDIKPSNILLDGHGRAKLTDFDLIRARGSCGATRGGLGTWAYAAPEVMSNGSRASVRSDVFSLGRTALYVLLAEACGPAERSTLPERWPSLSLGDIMPHLRCSTEVLKVIISATSVEPSARPQSVRDFVAALEAALDEQQHLLARRFQWRGGLRTYGRYEVHDAMDLQSSDGQPPGVCITRFSAAASRRLEAAFGTTDWTQLRLPLSHEAIPAERARGRDGRGRYWVATVDERSPSSLTLPDWKAASYSLEEGVQILIRVGRVVAYVHRRGIIHRDLCPEHVIVERGGTVSLGGWALATPSLFQPEHAATVQIDVKAIGYLLLYVASPGDVPFPACMLDAVDEICTAANSAMAAIEAVAPRLAELAKRCITGTLADIRPVLDELGDWLEHAEAKRRFDALAPLGDEVRKLHRQARALDLAARIARDAVRPWQSELYKRRWWLNEEWAKRLRARAFRAEQRWLSQVSPLCTLVPSARSVLLSYYQECLDEVDGTGDCERARLVESVLSVNFGIHALRDAEQTYRIRLDARRVRGLSLERYEIGSRVARSVDKQSLAGGTVHVLDLTAGGYVASYSCHGQRVRLPFVVRRGQSSTTSVELPAPKRGLLGEDEVFVAGGLCRVGGDELAGDGLPHQVVYVEAFIMKLHAVTHGEYRAFLQDLCRNDQAWLAGEFAPKRRTPGGKAPLYAPSKGDDSERWTEHRLGTPVCGVSWFGARAFAEWRSTQDCTWRLPHELEWEKAARGVDGRPYPWGWHGDESYANMANSHREAAHPLIVKEYAAQFPVDTSPYGVRGLGGNMRTWCINPWRPVGPRLCRTDEGAVIDRSDVVRGYSEELAVLRGGSFATVLRGCRSAGRYANRPGDELASGGIRLVRSASDEVLR